MSGPLAFAQELSQMPSDPSERHEVFVNCFGQFVFWLRKRCLMSSRKFVESDEARSKLGTLRRAPYEGVSQMSPEQREASLALAAETLDGFVERLLWSLGDEGTDAKFGQNHAYRFRIEMEIVDNDSGEIVYEESINRGGRFFGGYWGRWLNRYGSNESMDES